jgi:2-desacetyl-2-hydroxyethyl bacteriochlorophyllide A dehydrogenase
MTWYAIRVAGGLGTTALGAFPEFASDAQGSETTLTGQLPDSSALYGAVARLESLGLELLDVRRLGGPPTERPREMTAMVLTADRKLRLEQRPFLTPRADQVLVDVDLCGICGSDLHAAELPQVYRGGFILGHEPVGWIAAVGRDVTGWRVGQRVAINPNGDTCGVCEHCRAGRLNFCVPATLERAVGLQADGALAAQLVASPKTLHAVPDGMSRVESAWVEPAATALRAVRQAGELAGRSVLVVGGGPIGQLCCRLARHFGAARVWLAEPSPERRGYADASGVDRVFDPGTDAAEIQRLGADLVLECSGSERGASAGLAALTPQGTMVVVGGGAHDGLDPLTILLKELRVLGSFTYVDEFEETIGLLADGALRVADLTTAIVGIDDAPQAFERLREASTMKILIEPARGADRVATPRDAPLP